MHVRRPFRTYLSDHGPWLKAVETSDLLELRDLVDETILLEDAMQLKTSRYVTAEAVNSAGSQH